MKNEVYKGPLDGLVAANEFSIDQLEQTLAEKYSIKEKDFREMLMESETIEDLMEKINNYKRK